MTDFRKAALDQILRDKAVAVVRGANADALLRAVDALREGGVRCIEITLTVPRALELMRAIDQRFGSDVLLGVGSVIGAEQARRAVEAGARFVVSPVFKPEIVREAHACDAAALPGAFTPTEALRAHEAGADVVKVFPAGTLGVGFFRGVLAPMPQLRLMPTGGVTVENAADWIGAGAVAVGIGSALVDEEAVHSGNFAELTARARRLVRLCANAPEAG
jgi:2-dehydro-3-deoxyphosphogluconate aldolase/(4S)-4-hydroxy-2-oxoglutarate aldolase